MKKSIHGALALAAAITAGSHTAIAADVGVSISIGEPGFYGRIDIGDYPRPQLIYAEPMLIEHVTVHRAPVYLRVPPGHAKNWKRYCHSYNACGERVYFVQDNWYTNEYAPRYRERHGGKGGGNGGGYNGGYDDHGGGGHGNKGGGQGKSNGKGGGKGHD